MAFEGWLSYAGVEIINSARARAYAERAGIDLRCGGCPGLAEAIERQPWSYTTPEWDDAPWLDVATPESAGVLGFAGLRIDGLSSAPVSRGTTPIIGDGAVLGPLRRPHREVTVTLLVVAADHAAMSYAFGFLATALRGTVCPTEGCAGDELCFFASCPVCGTETGCGDPEERTLFSVGLLEGPEVQSVTDVTGGVVAEVEITLAAATPYIYRRPLDLGGTNVELPFGRDGHVLVDPDSEPECREPTDCLEDPDCPSPPLPTPPPVPRDPCFPTDPYYAARTIYQIPRGNMPEWNETVPLLHVRTGSAPLRRLTLRFHVNPTGRPCTEGLNPCAACGDVSMTYLPRNSELTVDGRMRRAWVDCPGGFGTATAEPTLYGPGGRVFEWPVFECHTGLCVEVLAHNSVADDARALVQIYPRQDAA